MSPSTLAQFEAESIAWINIAVTVFNLPLFGFYAYKTIEGVENLDFFLSNDPRGQELVQVLWKLFAFLILWIPMSIGLKIAATRRDQNLLKAWNIFQLIIIFIVALHLLIVPPHTLIMVFAYITSFAYFLISLWIIETLVQEIKQGQEASKFVKMNNSLDEEADAARNDNNNTVLVDSIEFRSIIDNDVNDMLSIQMKKVLNS